MSLNSTPARWPKRSGRPSPCRYESPTSPYSIRWLPYSRAPPKSLTTSLNHDAFRFYNGTIRNFLNFRGARYPQVQSNNCAAIRTSWPGSPFCVPASPLWRPSLIPSTFHLRSILEELAWTEDFPTLARLVLRTHPAGTITCHAHLRSIKTD
jgi:hypothetical protein